MSARSSRRSDFAASASLTCCASSESWWLALTKEVEEPRGGKKIAPPVLERGFGVSVSAPLLELPSIVDADRLPRLVGRNRLLEYRQRRDQRPADRHQRRQASQPERVERRNRLREPLNRRRRLGDVHQAGGGDEINIEAPPGPAEQLVPLLLLPI